MEAQEATGRRLAMTALGVFAGVLAFAPGQALAAFGLQGLSAAPDDTRAGANSDFHLHVGFQDSAEQVKDLTIHLPPGLVGNPTVAALCTVAQLNADSCPAAGAVGTVSTATTVWVLKPLIGLPLTVPGTIYNLEAQPGEPARFGIVLRPPLSDLGVLPKIVLQSAVKLRPGDFGLDTLLENIPNTSGGLAVDIESMDIVLHGTAGNLPAPFMRNPTSCATATTGFDASSYAQPNQVVSGQASFTPTACESLPFAPHLSASVGSAGHTADGSAPPLTTVIEQTPAEAGLRDATVLLPRGIGPSNDALSRSCAQNQFVAGQCPRTTVLGSATARSPLLSEALSGPVVLVAPAAAGQLPQLGLDLRGQLHLQLFGSFVVTEAGPGNSFSGLPDIPISRFQLSFDADHLISSTRNLCRGNPPVFHADYIAQTGTASSENVEAVVRGCGGNPGGGGAKPTASVRLARAGSPRPRLRFKARSGDRELRVARLRIPAGLRFAGGKSWKEGTRASADGRRLRDRALRHTRRALRVRGPRSGSDSLLVNVGGGALTRGVELGTKLRFRATLVDVKGDTTRLTIAVQRH